MKKILFTAIILITTIGAFAQHKKNTVAAQEGCCSKSNTESIEKHHIIMQLSSNDTLVWKGLMNNLKHLKAGWGDSVQIEVVSHGPGIEMLMTAKTTQQKKIAAFKAMGIVFVGCENTLKERNIPRDALIPEAGTVPTGVGEIVLKQEQGWSYIKVGF